MKRAALFIRMNDLGVQSVVVIPVVAHNYADAVFHNLKGLAMSPWSWALWNLACWCRQAQRATRPRRSGVSHQVPSWVESDLQKRVKKCVDDAQDDRVVITRRGRPAAVPG